MDARRNTIPIYCSKCSVCKQMNPSTGQIFFISCCQWLFVILVMLGFIVTVFVVGLLFWVQIGNKRTDSEMVTFSIEPMNEETVTSGTMGTMNDEKLNGLLLAPLHLNFSDAADYCKQRGWSLIITINKDEEKMLPIAINANKSFSEHCNKFLTGFRRIISEEWKTSKDEPILFDDDLFVVPRALAMKKNCVAMIKEYNYSISNVECKFNDPVKTACYICESRKCKANISECYKVFIDSINSVKEANAHCAVEMPESHLASIVNLSLHRDIVEAYRVEDPKSMCSYIYLGMESNWVYENVLEEKISYESEKLNSLGGSKDYCVSINTRNNEWETANCEEKMCFVCREGINIE